MDIAEPGAEFQATDVMRTPKLPSRRLIAAGCSTDHVWDDSPSEQVIVAKFVTAWESANVDARGPPDRRCVHFDATEALRIRGPRHFAHPAGADGRENLIGTEAGSWNHGHQAC